jgi:hypothetical protein
VINREDLARLYETVSVRDIMTKTKQLKRADALENAQKLFPEYDVVPYPRRDRIEGFFRRSSDQITSLRVHHLVSADTSILDIPNLLIQSGFYFVVAMNAVVGYVHFSDLNKVITKVPFFVAFQAAERRLWDKIEGRISEEDLHEVFDGGAKRLIDERRKAARGNVDLGWTGILTFPSILRLARHYGAIDLPDDEIRLLKDTRNKIAHSNRLLVAQYEDVASLAKAYSAVQQLTDG